MTNLEIKKYLKVKKLFQNPKIKKLGKGNNYQVFQVEENNEFFTLKMNRSDVVSNENLFAEYVNLRFLEKCKIDFVQKVIFYDQKNSILLLTFIDGKEVGINDLTYIQLEKYVEQLNILHKVSYQKYKNFCKKNKIKFKKAETFIEHLKRSGIKRFEYIKKNCDQKKFITWIDSYLEENIAYVKNLRLNDKKIIFSHGDLAGANIFLDKGKIFFIDWDKAKFIYNVDFYLNYIFIHGEVCVRRQNKIVNLYSKINKIDENKLKENIKKRMKVTKLNDIIWALMMYTEMKKKKMNGYDKYLKIAKKRKKEFLLKI